MPSTLVFDYPSVTAVTEFLTAQMLKSVQTTAAVTAETGAAMTGDNSDAGELALAPSWPGTSTMALVAPPRHEVLAVLAVVARPLQMDWPPAHPAGLAAGKVTDWIQRVPLERWDLDLAEGLQRDALTLSAQVGMPDCAIMNCCHSAADRIAPPYSVWSLYAGH